MAKFLALVYVPTWLRAAHTADAPYNDVSLYNQLQGYKLVDDQVASAAIKVIKRHTWYFAPEVVVFAMCSGRVSNDVKGAMAEKLQATPRPEQHAVGGNITVILDDDQSVKLPDLVEEDSWLTFNVLELKGEWLSEDPKDWDKSDEYRLMCEFVSALKVTNDTAERGVQLVQKFAHTLTTEEADMQWLLQGVEDHRKKFQDFSKVTLNRQ